MISVGSYLAGPETEFTTACRQALALSRHFNVLWMRCNQDNLVQLAIVFNMAGSLGEPDWKNARIARYSKKSHSIVVECAVPASIVFDESPFPYLVEQLHRANFLADSELAKKGVIYDRVARKRSIELVCGQVAKEFGVNVPVLPNKWFRQMQLEQKAHSPVKSTRQEFMLILQWDFHGVDQYDELVRAETLLIETLPEKFVVDGHEVGSDTFSIFIYTTAPKTALNAVRKRFKNLPISDRMRAAYTDSDSDIHTILFPADLKTFIIE